MAEASWDRDAIRSAKEKIRKKLLETRTRLDELFRDFDPLNRKKCNRAQAERALARLGASLSAGELAAIFVRWSAGDGTFRYSEFADFMDKVFTRKGLETNPDAKLHNPMAGRPLHPYGGKESEEEASAISGIIDSCAAFVASRGIIVKDFFRDFDRRNNGYVSRAQFLREIYHVVPTLNETEVQLLMAHYRDDSGDINYRAFHTDVTPDAVAPGRGGAGVPTVGARRGKLPVGGDGKASEVEDRLIRQCAANRVRPAEFFRDFDPKRTGYISRPQFLRGLINCKFAELPEGDMQQIADKYWSRARGQVCYADFCAKMDEAFTTTGLERSPTRTLDSHARALAKGPRRIEPVMTPTQKENLKRGMEFIRYEIVKRNFEMKPFFKDFDRSNEECVTTPQFLRVLKQLGAMPPAPQLEAICVRYAGPGVKARTHIDWRTFYQDVEPPDRFEQDRINAEAARKKTSLGEPLQRPAAPARDMTVALEKLLHKIKLQARKNQVRIHEFMCDFDKLRTGRISRAQFAIGLNNSNIRVMSHEVEALTDVYADVTARDAEGKPMVAWRQFTDDVESVFTPHGLESRPGADAGKETEDALYATSTLRALSVGPAPLAGPAGAAGRLSGVEEDEVRAILTSLDHEVKTRRLELPPHFREFDRHNRGVLTDDNFNRALDRVGLALEPPQLALVAKAFQVPATDRTDINYRWFYLALDNVDGVLGNLPEMDAAPAVATAKLEGKEEFDRTRVEVVRRRGGAAVADIDETMDAVQRECLRKRIKLTNFLQDGDPLRIGRLSRSKFRTAIAASGLTLTEPQIAALELAFKHDADESMVNWRNLASIVDGGDEWMERDPHKERKFYVPAEWTEKDTGVDEKELARVLTNVKADVSQHRTLMKPTFQGFDRLRKNYVTRAQFSSVCATLKLPISAREMPIVLQAFQVRGAKDLVNYHNFIRRVDESEL